MQTVTKAVEIAQVQLLVSVVDMPVVMQIQVPVRTIQKTVKVQQQQLPDTVVNMPVALQRQVAMVHKVQQTRVVPQLQFQAPQLQFTEGVEDIPAVQQRPDATRTVPEFEQNR